MISIRIMQPWIVLNLSWFLLFGVKKVEALSSKTVIQNAMQQMLHITPSRISHQNHMNESSPPYYMLQLYDKYLQSDSMKSQSNTVRSIIPIRGQIQGQEMLLFNLSALGQNEEITSVELHFYKKRHTVDGEKKHHKRLRHSKHNLHGFSVEHPGLTSLGQWEVALEKRGWLVYDVTSAVHSWEKAGRPSQVIGFMFQGTKKSTGKYETLSLETVLKMDPQPFLIIFSNELSNATLQSAGLVLPDVKDASENGLPEMDSRMTDNEQSRQKRSSYPLLDQNHRLSRSIHDNELPEADIDTNVIPQTNPGILQGRSSRPSRKKDTKMVSSTSKPSTLPYPKSHSNLDLAFQWPHDKKKKNRKGKRRNRKLPETWHYNQQQHVNDARLDVPEDANRSLCQRRKLVVDFAEIGWGEWIISPKQFEAHYCAGRCPFPLTKELNPTNHATIQSIVHAIGSHPEVPAPCCIPDVLSSLTLLYFDDNRNVVLKNYPSMTAESCACR